jgi:hypothetical protein
VAIPALLTVYAIVIESVGIAMTKSNNTTNNKEVQTEIWNTMNTLESLSSENTDRANTIVIRKED